jgi:LPXTG-motif cell wall-anchored protein
VIELEPDPAPIDAAEPAQPVVEPQFDKTMVNPGQAVMLDPMIGAKPTPGATFVGSSMQLWNGQAWVKRVRQPGVGTWIVKDGKVMFMPARDYVGTARGMFRVRDTSGAWAQNMLTVIVEPRPVSSVGISVLPKTGGFPVPLSLLAGLLMGVLGSVLVRIGFRRS